MLEYGIINDRSPHLIADLCEIICYYEDTSVSRGDIEEYITRNGGEGLFSELITDSGAETNERIQRLTEDAFQHLMYRQSAFADWYPFKVQHDVLELKDQFDPMHTMYSALLSDSRLKMFSRQDRSRLALEFEAICREAIAGLLPKWTIYHFGVGGSDRKQFGNKLKDALPKLAEKLRDDLNLRRINQIPDNDSGDGGIDIVAVHEWRDAAESLPVYFAQCAAQQENWPEKRFEAHPISLEKYFSFFHKPGSIMFIPVCYRGPDGQWIDSDGHQSILIDRLRIIELFQAQIDTGLKTITDLNSVILAPFGIGSFRPVKRIAA